MIQVSDALSFSNQEPSKQIIGTFELFTLRLELLQKHSLSATGAMDSSIQAVIFDVDGTLLDTETLSSEASDVELAKFGAAPIDWDLKRRIIGLPGPVWTDMVIKERNLRPLLTAEDLLVKWEANLDQMCPFVREVCGASVMMNQLKSLPIKLAVATSSRKNNFLHKAFNHHELFCGMEVVVCGDDVEVNYCIYPV